MRRLVNGSEAELADSGAVVEPLGDRLLVRTPEGTHTALVAKVGDQTLVSYRGRRFLVEPVRHSVGGGAASSGEVHAPMPGQITEVLVEVGATVEAGDKLLVLESMKTQQSLIAPVAGQVVRLAVSVGDQVQHDQMLALVEPLAQ